jgi:general secretion pathway protein H
MKREQTVAAGVTLMEMLVVIALASILLALVFPAVGSGLGTLELRSAATRLAAAARYARDQAVYRQRTYQLIIDSGAPASVAVAELNGVDQKQYELPGSVRVAEVLPVEQGSRATIRRFYFFPDGAAPEFQVSLASRSRQMTVIADPLTGTAKVVDQ